MKFVVPAQTFYQLSLIAAHNIPDTRHPCMSAVIFTVRAGHAYAWASSKAIVSCYYLGPVELPDGTRLVRYNEAFAKIAEAHGAQDAELTAIFLNPGFAIITTTAGYMSTENFANGDDADIAIAEGFWQSVPPDNVATKTNGALFMDTELLSLLGRSSPSGRFQFPLHIDRDKAVVVRDAVDPDWLGVFAPRADNPGANVAAELPEWLRR